MSSSSRNLIVHVQNLVLVNSYNLQTHQLTPFQFLQNHQSNAQYFLQFRTIFNLSQIKAMVFSFIGVEYPTAKQQYEFLFDCRQFCRLNGSFCFFPSFLHNQCAIITHTKTMVKEGEKVMIFLLDYPEMPQAGITLNRKKDCYEVVKHHCSDYQPFTQQWEDDMLGTKKPVKIIFDQGFGSGDTEKAQRFFQSYNPIVVRINDFIANSMEPTVNKILLLMDGKVNQYDVANTCWCKFEVRFNEKSLIKTENTDVLPFERSVTVNVMSTKRVSLFCNYGKYLPELFEEIKLATFKCKKVTVTLKLDYNSFYDFKIEPIVEAKKKENLSKDDVANKKIFDEDVADSTADEKPIAPEKARIIFDKHCFSVSYFAEGKKYNLNGLDGLNKTPIYISFTETKPLIGKAAMEMYNEKPSCVVFDLMKLCSITNADVESPKWGYSLSKENDSIIVTMQTVDGEKKSTVEFLLALVLKNGNDRIKKAYGKRLKDIEIGFDGFVVPNETLKKNFVEAGKLLNVNIVFV